LKSLGAILLLVAFFAQSFNQTFIVVGFYANQSHYARACENKSRPMLHCNGKCQLAKKFEQENKKEQQNPGRKLESKTQVIFLTSIRVDLPSIQSYQYNYFSFSENPTKEFSCPIFHPPSV